MSDFFSNLPDLVFTKIYKNCDKQSKWNLSQVLAQDGCDQIIRRTGVHKPKDDVWCFLCQMDVFWNQFGISDLDQTTLGFHWQFKKMSEEQYPFSPLAYEVRNNGAEDMKDADNILKYFEIRLGQVFQTNDIGKLRDHVVSKHSPNRYLPAEFWDDLEYDRHMALQDAMVNMGMELAGVPESNPMQVFQKMMTDLERYKRDAPTIVSEMLNQLQAFHDVGHEWEPNYLQYDGGPSELYAAYKPVRNFLLFCELIEKSHPRGQASPGVSLGKIQILI